MLIRAVAVAAAVLIVVLLLMTPFVQSALSDLLSFGKEQYPEYAEFSVERTLSVSANGGVVTNFTLDVPVPVDISDGGSKLQQVLGAHPSPAPLLDEDRYAVPWLVWSDGPLEGEEVYLAKITYHIRATTHIWNYGEDDVLMVSDIPSYLTDKYLDDEWKIDVSAPSIESRSAAIVGNETNVYAILRSIYDWIVENIDYPLTSQRSDPQSSAETLRLGVGDCDEQAMLFAALSRAAGVPSWVQVGALYDKTRDVWGGHGWVQTYLPLAGGGGANVTIDTVNRDFMVWKPNRFADFTDDGNADHLRDYYYTYNCWYVPESYPPGQAPIYEEQFDAVSYEESSEKVDRSDFSIQSGMFGIDPRGLVAALRPSCTCLASART